MNSATNAAQRTKIVGIGEALFDCFEDRTNLGGAPLNATLVAHAVGKHHDLVGQLVSRVGKDDLGQQVIEAVSSRGIDTSTIQIDLERPTGTVRVELVGGQPKYEICQNVAWDGITWFETLGTLASQTAGVSFGSLAQRDSSSRATIQQFLAAANSAVRLFDVNLRQSYYDTDVLRRSCELATAIKLNNEELGVVADLLELAPSDPITALRINYSLDAIILTHGERGTELITAAGNFKADVPRFNVEPGSDPVGAGDACGATCLVGMILDWPPRKIVAAANTIGAYVASRRGATPEIPDGILNGL